MKKSLYIIAVSAAMLAACDSATDNQFQSIVNDEECISTIQMDVDDFVFGDETRTAISTTGSFTWTKGDKIGVWPTPFNAEETMSQVLFTAGSGGASGATFNGSGWGLIPNRKYYAYYPYLSDATAASITNTYKNELTQSADNSTSHLAVNDFMYTSATTPDAGNTAYFRFHHFGSLVKFVITVPDANASDVFKTARIETDGELFPMEFTYVPTEDDPEMNVITYTNYLTLTLGNGITPTNGKLTLWFLIGEINLSGKTLYVRLGNDTGAYAGEIAGANHVKGKAHQYEITVTEAERTISDMTVDLGLPSGILWSKTNLTVNGLPIDETTIGDFYGWGELEPYYSSITINSESSVNYTWKSGYSGYVQASYNKSGTISGSYTSSTDKLGKEDDAAAVMLGDGWRIPSIADFDEMVANCTFTGSSLNGVAGTLVTSKINGNTVFFPATGYIDGTTMKGYTSGSAGARFWLSDCESDTKARQQYFSNSSPAKEYASPKDKWRGTPIRPVYIPAK